MDNNNRNINLIPPFIFLLLMPFLVLTGRSKRDIEEKGSNYEFTRPVSTRIIDFTNPSGEKTIFYDVGKDGLDKVLIKDGYTSRTLEKGDNGFEAYEQMYNKFSDVPKEYVQRKSWFRILSS